MNGTTTCMKKSCGRLMYNNEAHTVTISNLPTYVLCPDCAQWLNSLIVENDGKIIQQSMPLKEINQMLKEKASRYAEERFMMIGFPQRVALPA
jgi:uncharacterized radical SAM superfamily Fe-S cluster-containing enzyme